MRPWFKSRSAKDLSRATRYRAFHIRWLGGRPELTAMTTTTETATDEPARVLSARTRAAYAGTGYCSPTTAPSSTSGIGVRAAPATQRCRVTAIDHHAAPCRRPGSGLGLGLLRGARPGASIVHANRVLRRSAPSRRRDRVTVSSPRVRACPSTLQREPPWVSGARPQRHRPPILARWISAVARARPLCQRLCQCGRFLKWQPVPGVSPPIQKPGVPKFVHGRTTS
jgi:hypothetical protein